MNAITATRRTIRREWTAFGALLIVSVGLMGMSGTQTAHDIQSAANWAVMPVETFLNSAADTVGSYWSALTQIDRLRTENEQLKLENQTLQEELERAPAIAKLNDDWTKITSIASGVQYQTTPVRVIVRDVSGVNQRTLIVNKGSNDGLVVDEVVIDAGGALVGRIQSVDATVSTILLISDPASVVVGRAYLVGTASASASPTAAPSAAPGSATGTATGTISGTVSGQLQMSNIDVTPEQCKTLKGKYVVTAGESLPGTNDTSPYPPALLIGTITDVTCDPNAVVQSAVVSPAAELNDATFLAVITDYQGGFGPPMPSGCPGISASPGSSASPRGSASPGTSAAPGSSCAPVGSVSSSVAPSPKPSKY
jgi:cell shape-determining protein MreC